MKIDRLFAITNLLIDKKKVTAEELAEVFQVSVRTIYRDIDILSANGVPLYCRKGKGGGISIIDGYRVDKTLLSDEDQKKILFALEGMNAVSNMDVDDSLHKLRNVFQKEESNWVEIDFGNWEQSSAEKKLFQSVRDGIQKHQPLRIVYFGNNGKESERVVEPYKLIFRSNSWYLYGYCRLRGDFRFFKIRRIESLELIEQETFERKTDMREKTAGQPWRAKNMQVKLKFLERAAFRVYDEFRNGVIEKRDGYLFVTVDMPEEQWIAQYLLGFGGDLEVLEPQSLRESVQREIKRTNQIYQ